MAEDISGRLAHHGDAPAGAAASHSASTGLVIAGDIGGTSSRLQLATLDGPVLAEATGPGANLRSSGADAFGTVLATTREVLDRGREALRAGQESAAGGGSAAGPDGAAGGDRAAGELDPARDVVAVALGISGAGPARAAEVRCEVGERLERLGLPAERLRITDDLHTAFLAGGVGDDGLLVLAGTGAVAVRFRDREAVARRDGMGWLLGDIGSAVWLGRRTLEAVAADLDERGPRTRLTDEVGALLDLDLRHGVSPPSTTGDPRQDLIRALDEQLPAGAPAALGRFAPVPGRIPEDPVARSILDTALAHVLETVQALDPQAVLPVVLAGSVLATAGPLRDEVRAGLHAQGRTVRTATTGLPGALLLAREHAARMASDPRR